MVPTILQESRYLESLLEKVREPQMGAGHFLTGAVAMRETSAGRLNPVSENVVEYCMRQTE